LGWELESELILLLWDPGNDAFLFCWAGELIALLVDARKLFRSDTTLSIFTTVVFISSSIFSSPSDSQPTFAINISFFLSLFINWFISWLGCLELENDCFRSKSSILLDIFSMIVSITAWGSGSASKNLSLASSFFFAASSSFFFLES